MDKSLEEILSKGTYVLQKKYLYEVKRDDTDEGGFHTRTRSLGWFLTEPEATAFSKGKGGWGPQSHALVSKPSLRKVIVISTGEIFFLGGRVGPPVPDTDPTDAELRELALEKAAAYLTPQEIAILRKKSR